MYLTRLQTPTGKRWALDGGFLPIDFSLQTALGKPRHELGRFLKALPIEAGTVARLLAPIGDDMEVWACGVTYQQSWRARHIESELSVVYDRVYVAERPELFFKALGWRVAGDATPIRIRADSSSSVPEPEMVLVVNAFGEIVGYSAGNDVTARSIEAENPLYLPQAKIFDGACAVGPGLRLLADDDLRNMPIRLEIERHGQLVFSEDVTTAAFNRSSENLIEYLFRELRFPHGVLLMTGTGIVPPPDFSLRDGDLVCVHVNGLCLHNRVCATTSEKGDV
jgi:2-dehydro-3-deoxy-D-arabinonate dehydratase